ncbi:MAG: hypothetical protein KatS3mg004_3303 [Bryobacteraceae bacterium]|nr:MAG: hypothetical protein KatS3mg004_3303 [Bryobacteraceae bacterium]
MIFALAIALTAGVLALVFFVRPQDLPPEEAPPPGAHLEERKAVIYDNLRDLNFEYSTGKLSDEDYAKAKATLQAELEKVQAELERILAEAGVRGKALRTPPPPPAAAPAPPQAATVCPHCGARFDRPLKFCGECGKPLTGGAA